MGKCAETGIIKIFEWKMSVSYLVQVRVQRYYYWYICTGGCCYCAGDVSVAGAVVGAAGDNGAPAEG